MKLMILDGNSIVNRAYYGVRMLNAPDGTPTNGVYGFMTILGRLIADEKPDGLCVAFDMRAPTFRHERYDGYKATRKGMPDELAVQMPILRSALEAMKVPCLELSGWEADDIIGTVSVKCAAAGWDCVIVTGDKDSFQLITDTTTVKHVKTRMGQTETINYTPEVFREEYGFEPRHMVDLKALMGDASDNIPGVPGIGEKTAMALIQRFGSLEGVYENLGSDEIKPAARKKLEAGRESAGLSYELATIRCDAPVDFSPERCAGTGELGGELYALFKRLGFERLISQWKLAPGSDAPAPSAGLPEPERIIAPDAGDILGALAGAKAAAVYLDGDRFEVTFDGGRVYELEWGSEAFRAAAEKLFDGETAVYGCGVKELTEKLLAASLPAEGFAFDAALAGYILDATGGGYTPERMSARYLGGELTGAAAVWRLEPVMREKLAGNGQTGLHDGMELPLCRVLADMERAGVLVDRGALAGFGESLGGSIDALQDQVWELAGGEFNINSPKQLGHVLFEELGLPSGKKTKTGWSTNADVLEKLRGKHPIVDAVLQYRALTKLRSTYADGLLKVIAPDGRIHTSFQMTVTATGRLSSTEPNLQNIPIRTPLGAELRKMFVAPEGMVLVDADYSQIELRLLAHISGDEAMINAFLAGEDIHAVTASQVFGVPLDEVTPLMRSRAKAVNFGIVYGISAFSLAQDIGVFQNEAKEYIDAYLEKYHGVREYMRRIVEQARTDGYVETLYHRRRYLPELSSRNFNLRSFGERVALNMPIQGTAADIIKLAMISVHRRLREENLRARLILQVHDELIAECPKDEAVRVQQILKEEMQGAAKLSVPLTADTGVGRSWHEAH